MELYEHNKKAVEMVMNHYAAGNGKAAIVHATGTGKSYCIAAVVEHYDKCLVIAPNDYVLNETKKVCKPSTDFVTYVTAMLDKVTATDYDLIVLDEYHRAGAAKWGAAVKRLIDNNPHARLFGTTATDIRYLDGMRNMSDELFDGNVVSVISLANAWANNILMPPVYVTGLYSFSNVADTLKAKAKNNDRLSVGKKQKCLDLIDNLQLDWTKSNGVETILKKHLDKETKRVLVFCNHTNEIDNIKTTAIQWFANAGFKIYKTYTANYQNKHSDTDLTDFEKDGYNGIKLMFSVNMLNEGVHVPQVDAVIMLRPTRSKTIHLQQIGRCMTTNKKTQPVVFDLVDNLTNSNAIYQTLNEYNELVQDKKKKSDQAETMQTTYDFKVYDYVLEMHKVVEILKSEIMYSFDEKIKDIAKWCEENKRYPTNTKNDYTEHNYAYYLYMHRDRPEVIELRKSYIDFIHMTYNERLKVVLGWVEQNKRLPRTLCGARLTKCQDKERKNEHYYARFLRSYQSSEKRLADLIQKYETNISRYTKQEIQDMVIAFVEEHNCLPTLTHKATEKYQNMLCRYIMSHKAEPFCSELLQRYGYKTNKEKYSNRPQELIDFCKSHGRLPSSEKDGEKALNIYFKRAFKKQCAFALELERQYKKRPKTPTELAEIVVRFCKQHNRTPSNKVKNITQEERIAFNAYDRLRRNKLPEYYEIKKAYNK